VDREDQGSKKKLTTTSQHIVRIAIAVALFASAARAEKHPDYVDWKSRSYIGASGSWASALGDVETEPEASSPSVPLQLSLDSGWAARVVGGATWGPIRGEGELAFLHLDVDDINTALLPALSGEDGLARSFSVMGNMYYDFKLHERFSIYAGGGAGIAFLHVDGTAQNLGTTYDLDGDSSALALQGMVGLDFLLSNQLHFTVGYRLWTAFSADVTFVSHSGGSTIGVVSSNDDVEIPWIQSVDVGFRYEF
jgi:opacity protein-like surface antigen